MLRPEPLLRMKNGCSIRDLLNGSRQVEFERNRDFPWKGDNYVGYLPIYYGDRLRLVVGMSYEWGVFRKNLWADLWVSIAIGIIGLLLTAIVILLFLYGKVIRPVENITESVSDYTRTKDSEAVTRAMAAITSRNELGVLSDRISGLAGEIERYTGEIVELAAEKEKVAAELELAAEIQETMLPKRFPVQGYLRVSAFMQPAKEVGGDFYDFFMVDDDHVGFTIADVSGKGIPAALYMMMAKTVIKGFAQSYRSPAEVLKQANQLICENNESDMFVTVWFGLYELSTGHLKAASAGHEYPIIRQGGRRVYPV